MSKSIFYRLFGIGKIPAAQLARLQQEGIILLDEGIPGTATYTNFHSPRKYAAWRRVWYTSSIILTNTRLFALRYSSQIIDVPNSDPRLNAMKFTLQDNGAVLAVTFDPALFHNDWSGTIEYTFRTPLAQQFLDQLQQLPNASPST